MVQEILQRRWEPWRWGVQWPWEVDNDELRGSLKLILLELLKKLLKNSTLTILQSFAIWRKLDRWKRSISWYSVSWIKILKKSLFWSVIFSYSMQNHQIISWSDCDLWWQVDSMRQLAATTSEAGARRRSKAFPKANLYEKRVTVTVWWSATGLIHYGFLNPD